jgi:PAS domain S-box-containing protein
MPKPKSKRLGLICGVVLLLTLTDSHTFRVLEAKAGEPTIQVGSEIEFPPFAVVDENGQASGFSVDLIRAVAEAMNLPLVISTGPWDEMWNGLVSGRFDVLPIVAKLPDRLQAVDFSLAHTETFDTFFVHAGSPSIENIAAARGKKIGVMRSDAAHHVLLERSFQGELTPVETIPEGLARVADGRLDAFLCSKLIGTLAMRKHGIRNLTAGPIISDYKRVFCFGVRKGADELREKLNQGLLMVKSSGEYNRIYEKWLSIDDPWIKYRKYGLIALLTAAAIALATTGLSMLLRRQVRLRTAELNDRNAALQQEIAARRLIEDELRNHKEHLETLVENRTASLRESEAQFRGMFENHHSVMLLIDPETCTVIRANRAAENYYGYTAEAFANLGIFQINQLSEDDVRAEMARAFAGKKNCFNFRHNLAGGEIREVEVHSSTIPFKGKALLFSIVHDITDRKRAEEALEERIRFTDKLIEATALSTWISDENGTAIKANPACYEFFGTIEEEVIGKYNIFQDEVAEMQGVMPEIKRAYATGEPVKFFLDYDFGAVSHVKVEEPTHKFIQVNLTPIVDKNGRVSNVVSQSIDLTEVKRTEEALRAAKEAADAASRAKSTFLANMSHEIRTPLAGILGITELLLSMNPDRVQKECLDMITKEGRTLTAIISDILDLSQIEAGKISIVQDEFDIYSLISNVVGLLSSQARMKGIELSAHPASDVPRVVMGDQTRLRQVLTNLVGNALKFTDRGYVKIGVEHVEKGRREAGGPIEPLKLRFSVRDTGVGIPENIRPLLFKPFTQGDSSFTKKYQGTGLGLAITKQLVERMGGEVWFESSEYEGSEFFFTVVLHPAGKERTRSEEARETAAPPVVEERKPLRILLAEDEITIQTAFTHMLRKAGHEVVAVGDGSEVLAALHRGPFDLILMDVQMPEMDGVEATRRIRSSTSESFDPDIPVIALTAYAMKGDRERFFEAGMDDCVSKPVQMDHLAQVIRRVLGAKKPEGET